MVDQPAHPLSRLSTLFPTAHTSDSPDKLQTRATKQTCKPELQISEMAENKKPVYQSTSQWRNWTWNQHQLDEIKQTTHDAACHKLITAVQQENRLGGNTSSPDFVTRKEHDTLIRYYLQLFTNAANAYGLNLRIRLTAMVFFSRFFLKRSVMEHEPKLLLYVSSTPLLYSHIGTNKPRLACLFLASKVENAPASLDMLLQKTPNAPRKRDLIPVEVALCEAIGYDFKVKHVDVALDGAWMSLTMPLAEDVYTLAQQYVLDTYFTDALFLFWPSVIAWSCLSLAAKKSGITLPGVPPHHLLACLTFLEKQGISSSGLQVITKAHAKQHADKLALIKLPELDPASYTSRKRQREEEEASAIKQLIHSQPDTGDVLFR